MTTIATFFSSVTASTLQYSFQRTDTRMGGAVNLFWFVSLVFSVSSGVSSLLGMTWRRSSMWVYLTLLSHFPFQIWVLTDLDQESHLKSLECGWKRRLCFLNSSSIYVYYWSQSFCITICTSTSLLRQITLLVVYVVWPTRQPGYVSSATIVFTGLHLFGIAMVMLWLDLELKGDRKVARVIESLPSQVQKSIRSTTDDAIIETGRIYCRERAGTSTEKYLLVTI